MNRLIQNRIVQLLSQARQLKTEDLYEEAVALLEEICQLARDHLGKNHPFRISRLLELAAACRRSQNLERAEAVYGELIERLEGSGEGPLDLARSLNALGVLYCETSRHAQAIPLFQRSLHISHQHLSNDDPGFAAILNNLAGAHHTLLQFPQAERRYLEALEQYEELGALAEQAHCQCDLAELAAENRRIAECEERLQKAEQLYRSIYTAPGTQLAEALVRLADLARRIERTPAAIKFLQDAAEIFQRAGESREDELAFCLDQLSKMQRMSSP